MPLNNVIWFSTVQYPISYFSTEIWLPFISQEFHDPKKKVLHHMMQYIVGIFDYVALT